MAFGAITLFTLVAFIALVFNVGEVTSTRIRMQGAADAAAYSGALVEANSISTIAWINDGMAFIYYRLMRYAVDVIVFGVLAEMKEHGPVYPDDSVVGVDDAVSRYNEAYEVASEWIPKGEEWLERLSNTEKGIALITPLLMKKEIWRVARADGADSVALYPEPDFDPDVRAYMRYDDVRRFATKIAVGKHGRNVLPSWFDETRGRTRSSRAYHQTRECWNPQDIEHGESFSHLEVEWPYKRSPCGHWHDFHVHLYEIETPFGPIVLPQFHDNGHLYDERHPPDLPYIDPILPHHWIHICDTCRALDWDLDGLTDVRKFQSDTFDRNNPPYQSIDLTKFSLPLVLTDRALTEGVNVGVWKERDASPLMFYGNPEWGYFCVGSAKVGPAGRGGEVQVLDGYAARRWIESNSNLYESAWGAKLVHVRKGVARGGAQAVFDGLLNAEWRSTYNGGADANVASLLRNMANEVYGGGRYDATSPEVDRIVKH